MKVLDVTSNGLFKVGYVCFKVIVWCFILGVRLVCLQRGQAAKFKVGFKD